MVISLSDRQGIHDCRSRDPASKGPPAKLAIRWPAVTLLGGVWARPNAAGRQQPRPAGLIAALADGNGIVDETPARAAVTEVTGD